MELKEPKQVEEKRAAVVREMDQPVLEAQSATTFEEALHTLALQTRLAIGAHQCAISYVPLGDFHAAIHTHSFSEKYEKYNTYDVMPTGQGIWGLVVREKKAVRMTQEEVYSHPLFKHFSDLKDNRGLEHPPMPGWLAAPVLRRTGEVLGVIQYSGKIDGEFTANDLERVIQLANMILPTFELQYANQQIEAEISERKQAEAALRAREEQLRFVSDHAPVFIAQCDHERRYKFVNQPYAEMFGLRPADIIGKHPRDVLGEEAYAHASPHMEAALAGQPNEYDLVLPATGGGPRAVHVSYVPERDASGRVVGFIAAILDIAERKRAEQQMQALIESLPDGFLAVNVEGRIVVANAQSELLFGYPREELLGHPIEMLLPERFHSIHPRHRDGYLTAPMKRTMGSGLELYARRKDGGEFPVDVSLSTVDTEHARTAIAIVRDITERKEALEALREKNEELQAMSQQLWQTAKLATVGELAASVAHELNNPLATVSLRVGGLLSETAEGDPRRRVLEIIEQEVERMAKLVANLLLFSRRGQPQISTIDLREEITNAIDLIHHQLRNNQIDIVREFAPEVPMIQADRQQLRQLFLNLLTNAADAMPQGGLLTVRVAGGSLEPGTPALLIQFTDTGTGIPQADLPLVMEPFFTTKPEGKGTGLGLAICRRVVEEHRGAIGIESEAGKGTTVRITLPVANSRNGDHLKATSS